MGGGGGREVFRAARSATAICSATGSDRLDPGTSAGGVDGGSGRRRPVARGRLDAWPPEGGGGSMTTTRGSRMRAPIRARTRSATDRQHASNPRISACPCKAKTARTLRSLTPGGPILAANRSPRQMEQRKTVGLFTSYGAHGAGGGWQSRDPQSSRAGPCGGARAILNQVRGYAAGGACTRTRSSHVCVARPGPSLAMRKTSPGCVPAGITNCALPPGSCRRIT